MPQVRPAAHRRAGARAADGATALLGATVIDGTGAAPLSDAVVVIAADRIAAVRHRAAASRDGVSLAGADAAVDDEFGAGDELRFVGR